MVQRAEIHDSFSYERFEYIVFKPIANCGEDIYENIVRSNRGFIPSLLFLQFKNKPFFSAKYSVGLWNS